MKRAGVRTTRLSFLWEFTRLAGYGQASLRLGRQGSCARRTKRGCEQSTPVGLGRMRLHYVARTVHPRLRGSGDPNRGSNCAERSRAVASSAALHDRLLSQARMRSTAHINGHPIHPMLIPYPFAVLSTATISHVAAPMRSRRAWSQSARHMTLATKARRSATQHALCHALCNVSALACFAVADARRQLDGGLPATGLALAGLGTGLRALGGWLGGELVYHEHIGVADAGVTQTLLEADVHASG